MTDSFLSELLTDYALISKRFDKPPFPHKKAVDIINERKGSHFGPDMVVDAFLEVEDEFRKIAL